MELSLCPQPLYKLGLDGMLEFVADLGLKAIELPVDAHSPLVDLEKLPEYGRYLRSKTHWECLWPFLYEYVTFRCVTEDDW